MAIKTNNDKYLVFSTDGCYPSGWNQVLKIFKNAIKEAVFLGRVLVIDKYAMHPVHNKGHELNANIESYINLAKTQIYKREKNGNVKQISDTFRYINRSNFNLNKYPDTQVLQLKGITPVTEEQNDRYKVIIRNTSSTKGFSDHNNYSALSVSLYPSDEVNRLTDIALKAMGTSLAAVQEISAVYQNVDFATNQDILQQQMPNYPCYYAVLHVRMGDFANDPWNKYQHNPKRLDTLVRRGVPKGSRIYIMSHLQDSIDFDFLKKDYIVYQYHDFPELKDLVSGDNNRAVDNAILYSVERNLLQYAHIKIYGAKKYPRILYTGPLFKIPLQVRLTRLYRYLIDKFPQMFGNPRLLKQVPKDLKKALRSNTFRH